MNLTIYVLKRLNLYYDTWENVKVTTSWVEARKWKESATGCIKDRDFDMMQVEIPDDIIWEKT